MKMRKRPLAHCTDPRCTLGHCGERFRTFFALVLVLGLLVSGTGCEAFVRKFTRKRNKDNLPKEEMIIAPQEYKPPIMTIEEVYRQYFLYWKSWHDELADALAHSTNQKKFLSCADEAIKNLQELYNLLNEAKRKQLDSYLTKYSELRQQLEADIYAAGASRLRSKAENLRRGILRNFSYQKIKDELL
jgi:hypothetical protein